MIIWLFLGLQSGGGHGLILAPGFPNTGVPAHVQESAITIPPTLVRRSGERGTRSESDGRKAFHRQKARHLAVSRTFCVSHVSRMVFDQSLLAHRTSTLVVSLQYDPVGGPVGQANTAARCCLLVRGVWSD